MRLYFLVAIAASLLAGCAAKPSPADKTSGDYAPPRNDPYESLNRKGYAVNEALDRNVLRPVAIGYRRGFPEGVRNHIHNMLSNLGNPTQFANDVLEGKPHKAGNTFMRLVLNTTVGIGGVFDVASGLGFPDHDNDFGLTLAVWGVPEGPFLFLPVIGPSNPRDAVGYGVNTVLDPLTFASFGGSNALGWSRFGVGAVDARSRVLPETDSIEKTALDPYATFRSLYLQHRASSVAAARKDLPATPPDWYHAPVPPPGPARHAAPQPAPALAPPAAIVP